MNETTLYLSDDGWNVNNTMTVFYEKEISVRNIYNEFKAVVGAMVILDGHYISFDCGVYESESDLFF